MFQGNAFINIDAKGRLAIPGEFRGLLMAACQGRVTVTANDKQRCLLIYPEPVWLELKPQIESLPNSDPHAAKLQRLVLGSAKDFVLDAEQGRIVLPAPLRDYARLEKKLYLSGVGKKLELWSEAEWYSYIDNKDLEAVEPSDAYKAISL